MAVFTLLSALALGAAIVRLIPFDLYRFEAAALSVVLGLFTSSWLSLILSLLLPFDLALPLLLFITIVAAVALWQRGRANAWRPLEGGKRAWYAWGAATLVTFPILARLFWTHSLLRDQDGVWSAGASWADYGVHAAIISHIAVAPKFPTDLSIAAGEKLTYPFLIDLLSAMYVQAGWSIHTSLFWPGLLLVLAICQLFLSFGLRLFGRISVGIGALGLSLLIGSAAGTWAAWSDWRESGQGLFTFLGKLPVDYTGLGDRNANVTNLLVDALLPQRSILFGIGIGLTILTFLHTARVQERDRLIWPAAILLGLLPMVHPHTFMVGFGYFTVLGAERAWRTRAVPWAFIRPVAVALVIAAPQLAWQQLANGNGTGGRLRWAWMLQDGQNVFGYWWVNFGLMGLAFLAIPILMRRDARVIWFVPALIILAVTQLYAFQPFEYDNLKLIYWVYIVGAFFIAYLVSELVRRRRIWLVAVIPLGLFVMLPGALAILREFQLRYQFATKDDLALVDWVKRSTQPADIFATADQPTMPIATLAGRPIIYGYRGWLYNFSIPANEREAAVRAGFAGRLEDPLLKKFRVKYVAVSTADVSTWAPDDAALAARPLAYSNPTWRVYQVP